MEPTHPAKSGHNHPVQEEKGRFGEAASAPDRDRFADRAPDAQASDGNLGRGEAWLAEVQPSPLGTDTRYGDGIDSADQQNGDSTNQARLIDLSSESTAGGLIGAGVSDDAAWQRDRSGFQEHFAARHPSVEEASARRTWDQAEPTYRYGYEAARDEQYHGRSFEAVEPELRRAYEQQAQAHHHDGSDQERGWIRLREEVREGFNRFRDRA